MIKEFKEDRKLDNKRVSVKARLVLLSYKMGDAEIKRDVIEFKSMSGHCLDPKVEGRLSVSFRDIGKITESKSNSMGTRWEIYSYLHREEQDLMSMKIALLTKKKNLLSLVNSMPV